MPGKSTFGQKRLGIESVRDTEPFSPAVWRTVADELNRDLTDADQARINNLVTLYRSFQRIGRDNPPSARDIRATLRALAKSGDVVAAGTIASQCSVLIEVELRRAGIPEPNWKYPARVTPEQLRKASADALAAYKPPIGARGNDKLLAIAIWETWAALRGAPGPAWVNETTEAPIVRFAQAMFTVIEEPRKLLSRHQACDRLNEVRPT